MSHRSAPTLPFSTPPSYSHSYSRPARDPLRGLRPWSQPRTDEAGWTGARMSDASIRKQDTPIWRPPGPSEGHAIIRAHRRPPPPPHLGKRAQKSSNKAVSRGVPRRSKRHGQHERVAVAEGEDEEEEADEEYGEAEADSE